MSAAKEYTTNLAKDLTKITMTDFFQDIHSKFYPEYDISFMQYFLELTEHEDEFFVHHSKLREYGIMTTKDASRVKDKLTSLNLVEGQDFTLEDVLERGKTGAQTSKHYHLTPDAFKKCLMRAQRRPNQPADPVIYCDYYLLLEKVHKLYTDYERKFSEKLLSIKDEKIDSLHKKIDDLLGYAVETKTELGEVRNELHDIQNDLTETKEIADMSRLYLGEKSFTSTMNPVDSNLHHYFAATKIVIGDTIRVKLITGQRTHVDRQIDIQQSNYDAIIEVDPFYIANGIDLRNNTFAEFKKRRKQLITDTNARNAKADKVSKRKTPKVLIKNIPVVFNKTSFTYVKNPYMSYEDVLQVIKDVHDATQETPVP